MGVTDGSLIASLSVRRGNFDDLVWVIRYLSACPNRIQGDDLRATLTPLTVEFMSEVGLGSLNNLGIFGKNGRL